MALARFPLRPAAALFFAFSDFAQAATSPVDLETTYSGSPIHAISTSASLSRNLGNLSGLTPGRTIQLQFLLAPDDPITLSGSIIFPASVFRITRTAVVEIAAGDHLLTYTETWNSEGFGPKGARASSTNSPPIAGPQLHTLDLPWGTDLSNVTLTLRDHSTLSDGFFEACSVRLRGTLRTVSVPESPGGGTGGENDFAAADEDDSNMLTKAEFATTLKEGTSAKTVDRRFKKADRDKSGTISLAEYLIYVGELEPPTREELSFASADLNTSGGIDFDEFVEASPTKSSVISLVKNFLFADDDENGLLSLDEWTRFKNGKAKPEQSQKFLNFDLADVNKDGLLTPEEFSFVFPRGTAEAKVMSKFTKLDKNENDVLTREEWNPGGPKPR